MRNIVSSQKLVGNRKALEGAKRPTAGDECGRPGAREFFAMDGIMSRSPGWARATTSRGELWRDATGRRATGRVPPFIEKLRNIFFVKKNIRRGIGLVEGLLIVGIVTAFVLPLVQLWSIRAIPLISSNAHRTAAIALENLMSEALAKPFSAFQKSTPFTALEGGESLGLEGRVEIFPHPDLRGMTVIRSNVRWGSFPFKKSLMLEAVVSQNHA